MINFNIHDIFSSKVFFVFAGIIAGCLIQAVFDSYRIKKAGKKAIKKSRAVLGGQFGEQIAPFLPDFPCNPGDVRFVGKPVDFIGFPGSAQGKDIKEVLIIEVKSGKSQLSEREKQIKEAVEKGRVRYVEYRIDI